MALGGMSLSLDHQHNARIIHRALELGVITIDTADLYQQGFNEESIGKALADRREEVFLISKGGNQWMGDGWNWNPSPAYLEKALDASLKRLGTDRLDLYLLHGGTLEDPIDEVIDLFENAVRAGKILAYGISSIRPTVVKTWIERSNLRYVMSQYSLLDRRPEEQIFPMLAKAGVGTLVRGALAKGLLAGKAPAAFLDLSGPQVEEIVSGLRVVAGEQKLGSTALRFAQHQAPDPVLVVGASSLDQLEENAAFVQVPRLSEEDWETLTKVAPQASYTQHRVA